MENGCVNVTHILDTCVLVFYFFSLRGGGEGRKKFECILRGVHEKEEQDEIDAFELKAIERAFGVLCD